MTTQDFILPVLYDAEIIPKGCRKSRIVSMLGEHVFSISCVDEVIPAGLHIGLNGHGEVYYGSSHGLLISLGFHKKYEKDQEPNNIFRTLENNNIELKYVKQDRNIEDFLYKEIEFLNNSIKENENKPNVIINLYNQFYRDFTSELKESLYLLKTIKKQDFFLEDDDKIKQISDNKDVKIKQIQNIFDNYIISNNIIYKKTREPRLKIPYYKEKIGSDRNNSGRKILSYEKSYIQDKNTFLYPNIYFNILDMDIAFNCAVEFAKKIQVYTEPTVGYEDNFIVFDRNSFQNNSYKTIIDNLTGNGGFISNLLNRIKKIETDETYQKIEDMINTIKDMNYPKDDILFLLHFLKTNIDDSIIQDFVTLGEIISIVIEKTENKSNVLKTNTDMQYTFIPGTIDIDNKNEIKYHV